MHALEDLTDGMTGTPGTLVGCGTASVAIAVASSVTVYTLLPGFRANALYCAAYLKVHAKPGTMVDAVLGKTTALPDLSSSAKAVPSMHSALGALSRMQDMYTRRGAKRAPWHVVLKGTCTDAKMAEMPLRSVIAAGVRAVVDMHDIGYLHGDFKPTAIMDTYIIDLEMGTWRGRPRADREQLLSMEELRYRFW